MANIPGVNYVTPFSTLHTLHNPADIILDYNGTTVKFCRNYNIIIDGNPRNAAIAVFLHILKIIDYYNSLNEYMRKNIEIYLRSIKCEILNGVTISWDGEISICYDGPIASPVPDNYIKLEKEFNKLKKMKAFL